MGRIINGIYNAGIKLTNAQDNPVVITPNGTIDTTGAYGLDGAVGTAWSVRNEGSVTGAVWGVTLASGGVVTNGSAGNTNASISAGTQGVYIVGASGTIVNYGHIAATRRVSTGAQVATGVIVNGSEQDATATIKGHDQGVVTGYGLFGGVGTVVNFGTIAHSNAHAIWLDRGGVAVNGSAQDVTAFISGNGDGITVSRVSGTVANYGRIVAALSGVDLQAGGYVTNGSSAAPGAFISGLTAGVSTFGPGGTIDNYGTIASGLGTAVRFGGQHDRLIVHDSAIFRGRVVAGGVHDVLELAADPSPCWAATHYLQTPLSKWAVPPI